MSDENTRLSQNWFALAVKPRFDMAVASTLERKGYETFLALYRKPRDRGAHAQEAELPLFPGYVCCRFDIRQRQPVLTTPGVEQIFGAGNVPIALADVEVASLRTAIRARLPIQPFPFVEAGQRVRVEAGALAGVEGIVMSCRRTLRLVLSITPLQKSVLLEINCDEVTVSRCSGAGPFDLSEGEML